MTGRPRKDLTGQGVGHLTVLGPAEHDARGPRAWRCRCDCGQACVVAHRVLLVRRQRSCGCALLFAPRSQQAERNQAILAAWREGQTFAAIAPQFNLSYERVRQIIRKAE